MTRHLLAVALLVLGPATGTAEETAPADPGLECATRGIPEPDSIRAVRISARDRTGRDRVTVARVHSRMEDERREVLVEFIEPAEVSGSSVLLLEREPENELWLRSSELGTPRRIRNAGRSSNFLGTDFSYEDFEHLLAFRGRGETKRLEDRRVEGRPAYVLERTPDPGAGSAYNRILTFVDKNTCLALRTELYKAGRLRKQLLVNPVVLHKKGQTWLPQIALMEDLVNLTSTVIMVDSTERAELPDHLFAVPVAAR